MINLKEVSLIGELSKSKLNKQTTAKEYLAQGDIMDINHVTLVGRVASDLKFHAATATTKARLFLILATNRQVGKDQEPKADFIPITLWAGNAEAGNKYITRGKELGIEGSLRTTSVVQADGTRKNYTSVSVEKCSYGRDSRDSMKKQQADQAATAAAPAEQAEELLNQAGQMEASADAPF
jgi:single-strand DNA-binding protein